MKNSIIELSKFVREKNVSIYGITEIKDDVEQSESFVPAPWSTDVYSVSKFVVSAAVGVAYDEGLIDINAPITQLIADCPEPSEKKWKDVTLHDCMRHRTGLINGNLDIDNPFYENINDWLSYILALPIEGTRDVDYHYTDAAFYLAARALETAVNEDVFSYARRKLFLPLEFREYSWSVCPDGYVTGGSGFCANDRDLARLAYLWVNNGKYKDKQIISEKYINLSLKNGYGIDKRPEYPDFYFKTGANGQMVIMLPSEHRSIAIRGYLSSDIRTLLVDKFFTAE